MAVMIPIDEALRKASDDSLSALAGGDIFETKWKARVQELVREAKAKGIERVSYDGFWKRAKRDTEKSYGKKYP